MSQPIIEFEPPLFDGAIKQIILHVEPAFFICYELIDIAVLKNATRKCELLCGSVDKQCALHELAAVIASEGEFATEIKLEELKTFLINDALFR